MMRCGDYLDVSESQGDSTERCLAFRGSWLFLRGGRLLLLLLLLGLRSGSGLCRLRSGSGFCHSGYANQNGVGNGGSAGRGLHRRRGEQSSGCGSWGGSIGAGDHTHHTSPSPHQSPPHHTTPHLTTPHHTKSHSTPHHTTPHHTTSPRPTGSASYSDRGSID